MIVEKSNVPWLDPNTVHYKLTAQLQIRSWSNCSVRYLAKQRSISQGLISIRIYIPPNCQAAQTYSNCLVCQCICLFHLKRFSTLFRLNKEDIVNFGVFWDWLTDVFYWWILLLTSFTLSRHGILYEDSLRNICHRLLKDIWNS